MCASAPEARIGRVGLRIGLWLSGLVFLLSLNGFFCWHVLAPPALRQVTPKRIDGLDQANLLAPPPSFDFFLARNRRIRVDERFVMRKSGEVIATRESWHQFVLVLKDAANKMTRGSGVQDVRSLTIAVM